jgi:hypothetical protein
MSQKLRFDSNCIHRLSSYFWFWFSLSY